MYLVDDFIQIALSSFIPWESNLWPAVVNTAFWCLNYRKTYIFALHFNMHYIIRSFIVLRVCITLNGGLPACSHNSCTGHGFRRSFSPLSVFRHRREWEGRSHRGLGLLFLVCTAGLWPGALLPQEHTSCQTGCHERVDAGSFSLSRFPSLLLLSVFRSIFIFLSLLSEEL